MAAYIPPLSVREIYDTAESTYAPENLLTPNVVLVRARVGEGGDTPYCQIYADETFGWDAVTENIAVVDVEGGNSSMLQEPFVDSLAAALTPRLRREPKPVHFHSQDHKVEDQTSPTAKRCGCGTLRHVHLMNSKVHCLAWRQLLPEGVAVSAGPHLKSYAIDRCRRKALAGDIGVERRRELENGRTYAKRRSRCWIC